jgi:hypothetical protein
MEPDPSLDHLLSLDGVRGVIDEAGYWVKFEVATADPTRERPHGLDYSLTLHGPDNRRLAGMDNAHAAPSRSGPGGRDRDAYDHRHRFKTVAAYDYADAESLLIDFWKLVESVMRELGVWT